MIEKSSISTFVVLASLIFLILGGTLAVVAAFPRSDPFFADRPGRYLTNADLAAVPTKFEVRENMHPVLRLGVHNGVPVIDETICSDICPDYTVHIVRYDLEPGPACDRAGGRAVEMWIPDGIGLGQKAVCVPGPLAAALAASRNRGS